MYWMDCIGLDPEVLMDWIEFRGIDGLDRIQRY